MRIEVLEYFLEIAECRSFSQASSNLFISQQGLSKAMRALESELGVVLFRKKGRGIELTEEGSILKSHATEIVRQNDRARERFFKMQVGPSATDATVNVFATSYVCNAIFNLLDEELGEHGLDNCSVSECELNEIIAAIECGETNFGLVNILQEDVAELDAFPYLTFTPFLTMRITVKAPKSLAPTARSRLGRCRTCRLPTSTSRSSTNSSSALSKAPTAKRRPSSCTAPTSSESIPWCEIPRR